MKVKVTKEKYRDQIIIIPETEEDKGVLAQLAPPYDTFHVFESFEDRSINITLEY